VSARVVLASSLLVLVVGCAPTVASGSRAARHSGVTTVELDSSGGDTRRAPTPALEEGLVETAARGAPIAAAPPAVAFAPWPGASSPGTPRLVYVRAAWSAASLDVERRGLFDSVAVRKLARPFSAVLLDVTDVDAREQQHSLVALGVRDVPSIVLDGCGARLDPGTTRRLVRVLDESTLVAALEACLSADDAGPPP
jgi:hypothetical protein